MYQIIPSGLCVPSSGLGLHFKRKKDACKALRALMQKHPRAGYHLVHDSAHQP
jgi:hypothetical protein